MLALDKRSAIIYIARLCWFCKTVKTTSIIYKSLHHVICQTYFGRGHWRSLVEEWSLHTVRKQEKGVQKLTCKVVLVKLCYVCVMPRGWIAGGNDAVNICSWAATLDNTPAYPILKCRLEKQAIDTFAYRLSTHMKLPPSLSTRFSDYFGLPAGTTRSYNVSDGFSTY